MSWVNRIGGKPFTPRARQTDGATSIEAAAVVASRVGTIRERVLALFDADTVITQFEAIDAYRARYGSVAESSVRTRIAELVRDRQLCELPAMKWHAGVRVNAYRLRHEADL